MPRRLILVLLTAFSAAAAAQDIHFSQVDVNPMLFNPSYSGFFDGKARFGMVYRSQWASVSDPFSTFAATAEVALLPGRYRRNGLNIGAFLYRDKAGTLDYGTTAANAVFSYYQSLNYLNTCLLSAAVEIGYSQQGFNPSDAEMPDNTEQFHRQKTSYPTIGAGIAWFYQPTEQFILRLGVSGRNLNEPNISYIATENVTLHRRWNGYARAECQLSPSWSLLPLAAVQLQHNYREILYGMDVKWYYGQHIAYSAGLTVRHGDAIIADIAAEYGQFLISLSYDANTSVLTAASHTIGAFELAIVYHIPKAQNKAKAIPCATF